MVAITIQTFGGKIPRTAHRVLPDNYAQIAENCDLLYGDLRGYSDFKLVHEMPTGTNPRRVWNIKNAAQTDDAWFGASDPNAELIKSPIVNDAYDRYYLFQQGQPPKVLTYAQIAAGSAGANLAFGQPVSKPGLSQSGGSSTNLFTRVYTYTYVTSWGEESAPAPVRSINVREDATSVTVTVDPSTPGPAPTIAGRSFSWIRIYRSVTGSAGAQYYFVADVAYVAGGITYVDIRPDLDVAYGSVLTSQNDSPPDGIWGARVMGNGSIVAFKGREVYFSVPYLPHAWPQDWRLTVPDHIVGLEVQGQNVMVMTTSYPVLLYGAYPDAMGMLPYTFAEPCISYGSIVAAPEGVYYGSYNGLVLFTQSGPANITRELISRKEWQLGYVNPSTRAERLGTRYIASLPDGRGYVIDGQDPRIALTDLVGWLTVGDISTNRFTSDVLAISLSAIYAWDAAGQQEIDYRWKSKKYVLPKPSNLGALMLHIEGRGTEWTPSGILNPGYTYPAGMDKKTQMAVRVWMDGVLVFDKAVSDREQARLPSENVGTVWEIEVKGQCRVQKIMVAETGKELESV